MITENIIGFQLSAQSGKSVYAADPAALTQLPEAFSVATKEETDIAVEKAFQAWRIFRNTDGMQRAEFLTRIAEGIEALGEKLMDRIRQETAYPEARILGECNRTCAQLRIFAEVALKGAWRDIAIDQELPERKPFPRPDLRKMMMPLGPVVVFGASNFPLAYSTAGGDVASALASGCPVIVKAHDSHLGTNAFVAEVIMNAARETGMPDGVFSSLHGNGFETGTQLVLHPKVAAVGFTGSRTGGKALYNLGCQRANPIPVFAEMGSVNPIFILPGKLAAEPGVIASQVASSITMTVGQFCTNPGILVAMDDDHTSVWINELISHLQKVEAAPMLNQGIHGSFHKGIMAIRDVQEIHMAHDPIVQHEHHTAPVLATVPAEIFMDHPQLHLEIFGPFSLLVLCNSKSQMKQVAEAMEGQLTASVYMQEQERSDAQPLIEILKEKAGRIIMNGVPTGVEVCAAMTHGGPFPASSDSRFTAVGEHAIRRWIRPVTFQNWPEDMLPGPLKKE